MSSQKRAARLRLPVIALGVVLMAGPVTAQAQGPRAAIEAANAKFSADYAKGDAAAVAAHYTAAGQAFPPNGEIARGREAIQKLWKGAMAAGVKGVKLVTLEVEAHGDTAHEVGTYVLVGENPARRRAASPGDSANRHTANRPGRLA
jgi:ketosteroid isomerase-like protein